MNAQESPATVREGVEGIPAGYGLDGLLAGRVCPDCTIRTGRSDDAARMTAD